MRTWTQALALAPMVLGVVACSGDAAEDAGVVDAGQVARDAGQVIRDAGAANDASIADAGLADSAVRDGGANDDAGFVDAGTPDSGSAPDAGQPGCTYPAGAVEPMARDSVISPYSWASAIDGAGQRFDLDLTQAFCNDDPDIDWSPFDVLLFISIPAW